MKIILNIFLILLLLLSSCVSVPPSMEDKAGDVMRLWAESWDKSDIDQMMATYSKEIVFKFSFPGGVDIVDDWEELKAGQLESMNSPNGISIDLNRAEYSTDGSIVTATLYLVIPASEEFSETTMKNVFKLREVEGEWKIFNQDVSILMEE
ncbi:MAG: nuclear transport factor 2 family protein [Spirochaetales bacterium]|nr:nuclear transport factor 2 family protein [Spirochaetales bacterium]